jgi:uncharacterized protein YecE (DUF72 family)
LFIAKKSSSLQTGSAPAEVANADHLTMKHRTIRIGTAGWSVPSQYLKKVPPGGSHLERYARSLRAVEINSSFYRPHRRGTYERWAASTPDDFRFSVKLPKAITHDAALVDCITQLDRFAAEVTGLGDKLALLLVQLPPNSSFRKQIADRFFRALGTRIDAPVVLEPRHASWFTPNADQWLARRRIARAAADPARINGAGEPGGFGGTRYYRWHGSPQTYYSDYDAEALAALKQRLENGRASQIWCIFDNTAAGAALGNALALAQSVGVGSST